MLLPLLFAQGSSCCGPGTFTNGTGCADCPVGSSCPGGFVAPVSCPTGRFANVSGLAQCTLCPAGTYQNATGQTECKVCALTSSCPEGAVLPNFCAEDSNSNSSGAGCAPGTYQDATGCIDCEAGSYAASAGSLSCLLCPPGEVSELSGSVGCTACVAGTFSASPGGTACELCSTGGYCEGSAAPSGGFTPCFAGSYNEKTGSSSPDACQLCAPGQWSPPGQYECLPCAAGSFSSDVGSSSSAACELCLAGSASATLGATSIETCEPCEPGQFAATPGLSKCERCPAGEYQDQSGETACKPCEAGGYCAVGAAAALPCEAGTFSTATDLAAASECTDATPGHFATTGSTQQTSCAKGSYTNAPKQGECTLCAGGTYQDQSGETECKACKRGSYCAVGAAAPLPCEAGSYSTATDNDEASDCMDCPAGHVCSTGSVAPRPCRAGEFANGTRNLECALCNEGTSSDEGSGLCVACAIGTFSPDKGGPTCLACDVGTYAASQAQTSCDKCAAGTFAASAGQAACDDCPVGSFSADSGQGACALCPNPLSSLEGSTECAICTTGGAGGDYFLKYETADPAAMRKAPHDYCVLCPINADCSAPNTTITTLRIPTGYWRANAYSTEVIECRAFDGARGSNFRLGAGSYNDPDAHVEDSAGATRCIGGRAAGLDGVGYCGDPFDGPECRLCRADDHYLSNGDTCIKCRSRGNEILPLLLLVLGFCAACGLAAWAYMKQTWREVPIIGLPLRVVDRLVDWHVALGMQAKFKILLGFYQVVTVLPTTYGVKLPSQYTMWFEGISRAISFSNWVDLPCVHYTERLVSYVITPFVLLLLLACVGVVMGIKSWLARPFGGRTRLQSFALGMLAITPAALILMYCFVPSINAYIFRFFPCKEYDAPTPEDPSSTRGYMVEDANILCSSDAHDSLQNLVLVFLVIWPIGSLIVYTSLLIACSKPLHAGVSTALTRASAFLHQDYEIQCYWWEALELVRKLALTGLVLTIPDNRSFLRLVAATLICACHTTTMAIARPFKRIEDDILAVAASLLTLLLFLGANWITIFTSIQAQYRTAAFVADPLKVVGFAELDGIVITMITLILSLLILFVAFAIYAARRVAKVPRILLASTNQPPEFNLAPGLTWHLFNSHIWGTGQLTTDQDAVAVIKKQLMLLLPGIQVFLDVDDLHDIGALEMYIQRSQVILFFLSLGYFRSKNCLREIRFSLEKSKPIVLVQEADVTKGGGSLEVLRAECPEDLQPQIFDQGRALTPWMRIEDFQIVSLQIIAEAALLLHTPAHLGKGSLDTCVPGELRRQRVAFSKPVVLRVSPANPGAEELAKELADSFAGLTVSTEEAGDATHMLLYLNEVAWSDEQLVKQVKQARAEGLPIVMAHENDPARGGCEFSKFFETTPQELIAGGLYSGDLARACYPGRHHKVSLILLAKALGATPGKTTQDLNLLRRTLARLPLGNRPVLPNDDGDDASEASAGPQGAGPYTAPTVTAV